MNIPTIPKQSCEIKRQMLIYLALGLTVGFLVAFVVAFACHLIRFRPDPFTALSVVASREALIYEAGENSWIASLPQDVQVRNDNGIGFRRLEIRYKSGAPGMMRYHYLTSLGWPQPIFSSGSPWLGRYCESDSPSLDWDEWSCAKVLAGDSSTTLHWAGIIFDTLTFGLPICAAAMWLRRSWGWPSVVLTVITVAWWLGLTAPALGVFDFVYCANGSRTPTGVVPEISKDSLGICHSGGTPRPENYVPWHDVSFIAASPEDFARRTGSDPFPPPPEGWNAYWGQEVCGFMMSHRLQEYLKTDPNHSVDGFEPVVRYGESVSAGWPMETFSKGDSTHPVLAVSDLSHLDVQWLLWLVNLAVLSAALAIICYPVMRIIRRWRRVAPGQCTTCRYSLNGSAICPECGHAFPSKR